MLPFRNENEDSWVGTFQEVPQLM